LFSFLFYTLPSSTVFLRCIRFSSLSSIHFISSYISKSFLFSSEKFIRL
jgi:hypothetical protein